MRQFETTFPALSGGGQNSNSKRRTLNHIIKRDSVPLDGEDVIAAAGRSPKITSQYADEVFNLVGESHSISLNENALNSICIRYLRIQAKSTQKNTLNRLNTFLKSLPHITEIYLIEGDWDYLIKVCTATTDDQRRISKEFQAMTDIENSRIVGDVMVAVTTKYHELSGVLSEKSVNEAITNAHQVTEQAENMALMRLK